MAQKNVVVAPVGDNMNALFIGIKEFPTEKIILISPEENIRKAEKAKKDLERFGIQVHISRIKGNVWEELFRVISEIKGSNENVIVNVATGDRNTQCAATSAAFVNGIKAFSVEGKSAMVLPVLKFNYYKLLTDRKMAILRTLYNEADCCSSLEQLGRNTGMSLPLISYHINGSSRSDGLLKMGLIEADEKGRKTYVSLSMLGRLLMKGYVEQDED